MESVGEEVLALRNRRGIPRLSGVSRELFIVTEEIENEMLEEVCQTVDEF